VLAGHRRARSPGLEPRQRPGSSNSCSRFCRPRKLAGQTSQPLQQHAAPAWVKLFGPAATSSGSSQFPTPSSPIRPSTVSTRRRAGGPVEGHAGGAAVVTAHSRATGQHHGPETEFNVSTQRSPERAPATTKAHHPQQARLFMPQTAPPDRARHGSGTSRPPPGSRPPGRQAQPGRPGPNNTVNGTWGR